MSRAARVALALVVALAAGLGVALSLRGGYWFDSHEKYWYPVRLVEYVEALRAGALYPRWCPDLFGGYGYPFFNYYPPGVFALAAPLVALGLSPGAALKGVMAALAAAGAAGMFGLTRGETRRSDAALVAALAFAALPYRTADLLIRGDLAEYAGLALVPLALWGQRAFLRADAGRAARTGVLAALAHAAVILCHTLTGLFLTETLGVLALLALLARRADPPARRRALASGLVLALGLALAAVYLVPTYAERWRVQFVSLTAGEYQLARNFIAGRALVEAGRFFVGWAAVVGLGAALLALAGREARARAGELLRWWAPAVVFAALALAPPLWRAVPLGAYAQFPWRMLGFAGIFAAAAVGVTWAIATSGARVGLRWPLALAAAAALYAAERPWIARAPAMARTHVPETPAAIQALAKSSTSANEYTPSSVYPVPHRPRAWAARVVGGAARVEARSAPLVEELTADAEGRAELDVARFDFPGWRLTTVEGPAPAALEASPNGLLRVTLPRAGHYRLRVAFGSTPLRDGAAGLSLLALLLAWPLLARACRGTLGR